MISLWVVLWIVSFHYVSDFVFQNDKMARGKSKSNTMLGFHVGVYSSIWIIPCIFVFNFGVTATVLFCTFTFLLHFITDYISSRISSKLYAAGKLGGSIPNFGFFSVIGLDQMLHYYALFITYYLINFYFN